MAQLPLHHLIEKLKEYLIAPVLQGWYLLAGTAVFRSCVPGGCYLRLSHCQHIYVHASPEQMRYGARGPLSSDESRQPRISVKLSATLAVYNVRGWRRTNDSDVHHQSFGVIPRPAFQKV